MELKIGQIDAAQDSGAHCGTRIAALAAGVVGFAWSASHPSAPMFCVAAFIAALALFAQTGNAWLTALPVAYAIGDFYPWTGRLLVSEADIVCAAAVAVLLWRDGIVFAKEVRSRRFLIGWLPLAISVAVAFWVGWNRLSAPVPGDELSLYGSRLNAERVAKGFVWGLLFAPFAVAAIRKDASGLRSFLVGVRVSAAIVGAVMVWERMVTVGLLNFDDPYRATGPMFSSHVGGMQIDAYWAVTIPLLLIPPSHSSRFTAWLGYFALVALGYFSVATTMSRGVILVVAGQSLMILFALAFHSRRQRSRSPRGYVFGSAIGSGVVLGVMLMVAASVAMWGRLAGLQTDWGVRWSRWSQLCCASATNPRAIFIGNGLGVVPNLFADAYHMPHRPAELIQTAGGQPFLRLTGGRAVFVEQLVDVDAPGPWRLTICQVTHGTARLSFHLCRKSLYRTFECIEAALPPSPDRSPREMTFDLNVAPLRLDDSRLLRPPVSLALSVSGRDSYVDVPNMRLSDSRGRSLLENTDFRAGSKHWFFSSDDFAVWRADNLWVQLLVEQGLFGVIAFTWLVGGTLGSLARASFTSSDFVPISIASSILGFLAIGVIGSLVDVANLTSLLLLCIAIGQAECSPPRELAGDRV